MEHEKKTEKKIEKKKIVKIVVVIIIILLAADSMDPFTSIGFLSGINVMNWTVFITGLISSTLAVFGTWFVTTKALESEKNDLISHYNKQIEDRDAHYKQQLKDSEEHYKQQLRDKEEQYKRERNDKIKEERKAYSRNKHQESQEYFLKNYLVPLRKQNSASSLVAFTRGYIDAKVVKRSLLRLVDHESQTINGKELFVYYEELYKLRIPLCEEFYTFLRLYCSSDFSAHFELKQDKTTDQYYECSKLIKKANAISENTNINCEYIQNRSKVKVNKYVNIGQAYTYNQAFSIYEELIKTGTLNRNKKLIRLYNNYITGNKITLY